MNPYLDIVRHDFEVLRLLHRAGGAVDTTDWRSTLIFYIACHYVNSLAHSRGVAFADHTDRRRWLNSTRETLWICKPYRMLEERSRAARYDGRTFSTAEMREHCDWMCLVRDLVVACLVSAGLPGPVSVDPYSCI